MKQKKNRKDKRVLHKGDTFVSLNKYGENYRYMYCGKIGNEYLLFDYASIKDKTIPEFFTVEKEWAKQRIICLQTLQGKLNKKKIAETKRQRYITENIMNLPQKY